MKRRSFLFMSGAAAVGLAAGGQREAVKVIRERPPGPEGARILKLRLDASPGDANVCCGPGKLYVTDLTHQVRFTPLDWSSDGVLSVALPPREPAAIHADIAVPEYGRVWVTLDNEGAGYSEGNREPLSLMHEAVRSRLARCERRLNETMLASPPTLHLNRAREFTEGGKLADALREAILAGEEIEFACSQDRLALRGFSPEVRISGILFGERLGPWAIGVGPDWPMGAEPPDFLLPRDAWLTLSRLINGTTLPTFWRWIEPERGKYRWRPLEEILDFCEAHGIAPKSFAIFWGGLGGTPPWWRHLRFDQQKQALGEWCRVLVTRYRGRVKAWETVNEMHDWWFANPLRWSHEQMLDITRMVNEQVGALDPGTPRVINNCCIWGEYLQGLNDRSWTPRTYLEDVIAAGIRFEGIGLQYYNPGRDLMECAENLERYHRLGRLIWITEMGTPSSPRVRGLETAQADPLNGWRGPWSDVSQADWCEMWFTMALARPFLRGLNWWDTCDARAFIADAGWLDRDYQPKASFERLLSWRRRWRTSEPNRGR
jgi:endo-1,4-beta-xylanase